MTAAGFGRGVPIDKGRPSVAEGKGVREAVAETDGAVVDAGNEVSDGGVPMEIGVVEVPTHPTNSKKNNPTMITNG